MAFRGLVEPQGVGSKNAKDSQQTQENRVNFAIIAEILDPSKDKLAFAERIQKAKKAIADIQYQDNSQLVQKLVIPQVTPDIKILNSNLDFETNSKLVLVKKIVNFCHGAYLAIQKSSEPGTTKAEIERAQREVFTIAKETIGKMSSVSQSRAKRQYTQEVHNDLRAIVKKVADVRKTAFTDEVAKTTERELIVLAQVDKQARLDVHNTQLAKIENAYLVALLKYPEKTGQYLTTTNKALERLNTIVWMGVEDEKRVFTAGDERELLKEVLQDMSITLNEAELTAVQQDNAHLRKHYRKVTKENPTLPTKTLKEIATYRAIGEKSKNHVFNGLAPGNNDVALAYVRLKANIASSTIGLLWRYIPDNSYSQRLQQLIDTLDENSTAFFRELPPKKIIEKSSEKPKKFDKESEIRSNKQQELYLQNEAYSPSMGELFAEQGHELTTPESLDLLRQRVVILNTCLKTINKPAEKKIRGKIQEELQAVNLLISRLESAIIKNEVINKKIANLRILQAEMCVKITPLALKLGDFIKLLDEISPELAKVEFLLKHANGYSSYIDIDKKLETANKSLVKLTELEFVVENLKSFEANLAQLEELDPKNEQLSYFKELFKQLKTPSDDHLAKTWQQVEPLVDRWQKLHSSYEKFHAKCNEGKIQFLGKLYSVNYQPENVFSAAPQKMPQDLTTSTHEVVTPKSETRKEKEAREAKEKKAKEKREKDARRKNHENYMATMKKLEARVTSFSDTMKDYLAVNELKDQGDHKLTANGYLALQQMAVERASVKVPVDSKGNTLTPAQAIAELGLAVDSIEKQNEEYASLHDKLRLATTSNRRATMDESLTKSLELAQMQQKIGVIKREIIEDLGQLEVLRLKYKKEYLKILINPVLSELVEKYPNIFSDDLAKQQRQVAIFNKALMDGLSHQELNSILTHEKLQLDITFEDFAKAAKFNQLIEVFDIADLNQLKELLQKNGIEVSPDALKKFLAFDRSGCVMQEQLKVRATILAVKQGVKKIRQQFNETYISEHALLYQGPVITEYKFSLDRMGSEFEPCRYAKQLGEMIALIEKFRYFDYTTNFKELATFRVALNEVPSSESLVAEINQLHRDMQRAQKSTKEVVQTATDIYANKLSGYYDNLINRINGLKNEVYQNHSKILGTKDHYALLSNKVDKNITVESVTKYLEKLRDAHDRVLELQDQLSRSLDALKFAGTLSPDNISRQYFDKLQQLKANLTSKLDFYLKTYEGRIIVAEKRLESLQNEKSKHVVLLHKKQHVVKVHERKAELLARCGIYKPQSKVKREESEPVDQTQKPPKLVCGH